MEMENGNHEKSKFDYGVPVRINDWIGFYYIIGIGIVGNRE